MAAEVRVVVGLPRERAVHRDLRLGERLVLGRGRDGPDPDGAHRIAVPGRWLGVSKDAMVSAELLRITYADLDHAAPVITWRTRAQHHPAGVRFRLEPASTDTGEPDDDLAGAGRIVVRPGRVTRLVVCRLSAQRGAFLPRFAVSFAAGPQTAAQPVTAGPQTLTSDDGWLDLVEVWWRPRRRDTTGGLTWQAALTVTADLAAGTATGRLAEAVTERLRAEGHADLRPDDVRKAWHRAFTRLAAVLAEPQRAWMIAALAVPGLADHLRATRAGGPPAGGRGPAGGAVSGGRLASGEPQVRALVTALRSTGRPEWR